MRAGWQSSPDAILTVTKPEDSMKLFIRDAGHDPSLPLRSWVCGIETGTHWIYFPDLTLDSTRQQGSSTSLLRCMKRQTSLRPKQVRTSESARNKNQREWSGSLQWLQSHLVGLGKRPLSSPQLIAKIASWSQASPRHTAGPARHGTDPDPSLSVIYWTCTKS